MRHGLVRLACAIALVAAPLYAQSLPPTVPPATGPDALSTIDGKALTATNAPIGGALLRLRNLRFGQIVSTTTADGAGQFDFKGVDMGIYLVEMMNPSGSVLASSSVLYVGPGEVLSTIVKMPPNSPALGSPLINAIPAAAFGATAAALAIAASNTPAATPAGEPATSQNPSVLRRLR